MRGLNEPPAWVWGALAVLLVAPAASGCDDESRASSPGERRPTTLPDGRVCFQDRVYRDTDGDGFGVQDDSRSACLAGGETLDGYAPAYGDCAPDDPQVHAGADEICGDNLDENCDPADERCPESLSADIRRPAWDCSDDAPPDHVLAWARFEDNDYYMPGACFVFFEGLKDEFYVEPVGLEPSADRAMRGPNGECQAVEGCVCPSVDNWSYDRGRLYALTTRGEPADCDEIVVYEQRGDEQVVSNECRKFLYQIWFNPNEFSFVTRGEDALRRRIERFPQVEIACFEGQPFDDLPFASLLTAPIRINPGFVAQP